MKRFLLKANACLLLFIYLLSYAFTPSILRKNDDFEAVKCDTGASNPDFEAFSTLLQDSAKEVLSKDVKVSSRLFELLFGTDEKKDTEQLMLYPGGSAFGLVIDEDGVTVLSGSECKALRAGDRITGVNGRNISSPEELEAAIKSSEGKRLTLSVIRSGEALSVSVTPKLTDGEYKLGVRLRSHTAGIGTITFIEPEALLFGGLGHGVSDSEGGGYVSIKTGSVTPVTLGNCKRGEAGHAGELTGVLRHETIGSIEENNECGVFGKLCELPDYCTELMPVGKKEELKSGKAQIISTVKNGLRQTYDIEIYDIDQGCTASKSFKIKVTDDALIALTGGIVRGMSGSPIIQDGKLVGAVTHVMVADPTEGYGIFIENMLSAAENTVPKAA